jgi:hypothetical protein
VVWAGLVWLRVRTSGEHFSMRYWDFGLYKMLGNSCVFASRIVLSSIGLVTVFEPGI